jgi:hypothetical protein
MRSFLGFVLVSAAGCATSTSDLGPADQPAADATDPFAAFDGPIRDMSLDDVKLPSSLTCVSEPAFDGRDWMVTRAWITVDGGDATITMQRGPQFWSHSGVWAAPTGEMDVRELTATGGRLLEHERAGVDIGLQRDGNVFRGRMVEDACYLHFEAGLTCWNDLELFGSPWAGIDGTMDAHFDWSTGQCTNAAGEPALNDLPVEVVREEGWGECVDLRGQSLNGDDLAYPDLQGWFLPGARLDGASLYFAGLEGASLQGAHLGEINFGYATIEGSVDDFTELPGSCETSQSPWAGTSTTCQQ